MYISRTQEAVVERLHRTFKVVYIGGPRQVGKTTMLQRLAEGRCMQTVSLDRLDIREEAQSDPELFLENHPAPLFVDEAQYAPELFPAIKHRVDRSEACGQYWLSGSQQFSMMEHVQESLAGRVGIAHLLGFSWAEERRMPASKHPFPTHWSKTAHSETVPAPELFERMLRGSFPRLKTHPEIRLQDFFDAYIQTYIERDVRRLFGVEKTAEFTTFLRLCASRTGQLLNIADLARDAGVSPSAAKEWLSILQSTMQILLVRPYHANIAKRMVKAPKLYFLDTGLAAHLTHWTSPETLRVGAMAGAFFETFVVGEIVKSFLHRGIRPPLWFFRDYAGNEVDLLVEDGQAMIPIEIRMASVIRTGDAAAIARLRHSMPQLSEGIILCLAPEARRLNQQTHIVPVSAIV